MPAWRVVLDTNVLVSALVFRSGSVSRLPTLWQSGALTLLASPHTMAELERVLRYPKFNLAPARIRLLLSDYRPWCEIITVPTPPPAVPVCRDPTDRPFLELARYAAADALVTGDADLHALAGVFAVPIITPDTLLARLENSG